jgi:hypothetical protein
MNLSARVNDSVMTNSTGGMTDGFTMIMSQCHTLETEWAL